MNIDDLIRDKGLRITVTKSPNGHDCPRITDDNGYSILLWDTWGKKMGIKDTNKDSKGTLLYITDDLVIEETPAQKEDKHYHDNLKDYWMNINGGNER
jgi:hypothetical protein